MNIAEWALRHAKSYGESAGIVHGESTWTNNELLDNARRVAVGLINLGLRPGDRVAISLPHSAEFFIACMAVWVAGGVVVVLSEDRTSDVERLVEHSEAKLSIKSILDENRIVCECPSGALIAWSALAEANVDGLALPVPRTADQPSQLCYTSGSTGDPKAVVYTHGSTVSYLKWRASILKQQREYLSVLVALPPTAFASRLAVSRLAGNYGLVLLSRFEPSKVLEAIEAFRIAELPLVPTMAEQLAAHKPVRSYDLSTLRTISIGGARVPRSLVVRLRSFFKEASADDAAYSAGFGAVETGRGSSLSIEVVYGLTEAGGSFARSAHGGENVVGPVATCAQVRVAAQGGRFVGRGEVGEILVRTPFQALGYYRNEESTRKVFRDGFVFTGDVGYINSCDELCVLGRKEELVIQGGQNIYPEEIASTIRHLKGVADCAVIGMPDELMGEAATACVVADVNSSIGPQEVRQHCRHHLSGLKNPANVIILNELPYNSSGKVNYVRLRAMAENCLASFQETPFLIQLQQSNNADRVSMLEHALEAKLNEVLFSASQTPVSAKDTSTSFGECGLTSLGAVELASAISRTLGRKVSPTLLFSFPSVKLLAEHIASKLLFSIADS